MADTDDLRRTYLAMLLPDRLRDDAEEWDLGQCPMRAETSRQAADRIEQLERERDEARARADELRTFVDWTTMSPPISVKQQHSWEVEQ